MGQVTVGRRESLRKRCLLNRLFCQQHLAKFSCVGPFFFAVLTITPSFLIRFWPVKCRIEALITFFRMVQGRSVRFSFRSGKRSGQTLVKLGQPWSNLVEFGQSSPNSWKCIPDYISRVSGYGGSYSGWKRLGQTSVNPSQTWSTLVKLGQTLGNVSRTFFIGVLDVARPRRVMLAQSGLSRFACRHPRKSCG